MCELLNQYDALKTMMVLMGSYDHIFLSVDDLEEIELTAEELKVKISDRFDEIDAMYNSMIEPNGYEIFNIWKEEIEKQYSEIRGQIAKILCEVEA